MLSQSSFFSSMLTFFFENQANFMLLASAFQKNVNSFKNSIEISKEVPSLAEIESFLSKFSQMKSSDSFRGFFERTKVFLVWMISFYGILISKSFENFVKI